MKLLKLTAVAVEVTRRQVAEGYPKKKVAAVSVAVGALR